jgi:hypothetical protein
MAVAASLVAIAIASSISMTIAEIRINLVGLKLEIDSHLIKLGPGKEMCSHLCNDFVL